MGLPCHGTFRRRHLSPAPPTRPPGQVRQSRTQIRDPDIVCAEGALISYREGTEERAVLTLMRWVPDRRAAALHLSGMTVARGEALVASQLHVSTVIAGLDPAIHAMSIRHLRSLSVVWVTTWIPRSSHGRTIKQGDAINPSLVIPGCRAFDYPPTGGFLYRPGLPLFFGRPRLRFSSAGSS